jgi:hypothetical protein
MSGIEEINLISDVSDSNENDNEKEKVDSNVNDNNTANANTNELSSPTSNNHTPTNKNSIDDMKKKAIMSMLHKKQERSEEHAPEETVKETKKLATDADHPFNKDTIPLEENNSNIIAHDITIQPSHSNPKDMHIEGEEKVVALAKEPNEEDTKKKTEIANVSEIPHNDNNDENQINKPTNSSNSLSGENIDTKLIPTPLDNESSKSTNQIVLAKEEKSQPQTEQKSQPQPQITLPNLTPTNNTNIPQIHITPSNLTPNKEEPPRPKKISFEAAKKEIDDFTLHVDKIEQEIKDKYGISIPEFYYEDLLPDDLKIKLVDDFFNSKEINELANKKI